MRAEAKPITNCDHKPSFSSFTIQNQNGEVLFLSTEDDEALHSKCDGYQPKDGVKAEKEQPSIINPETNEPICLALSCKSNKLDLTSVQAIPHELVKILFTDQ